MSNLDKYLNLPVKELVEPLPALLNAEEKERHRIYSLLLMACLRYHWNGMKNGREGAYPLNPSAETGATAPYLNSDYLGHNIAALAVDADGHVIDFDFNHNEIFNSSVEHAESRLIRRIFSLSQVYDSWNLTDEHIPPMSYGNMLNAVTVYTSLESCAQCSGIMALGQVKSVVYLQTDPGMYSIGNILRRLTEGTKLQSPLPVSGKDLGLSCFSDLDSKYQLFSDQQRSKSGDPFFLPRNGHPYFSESITSFLCTRDAYDVYLRGESQFDELKPENLEYPDYRPKDGALSNSEVLIESRGFRHYVIGKGRRGTPHH